MTQLENLIAEKHISYDWDYLGLIQEVIERIDNIEELTEENYLEYLWDSIDTTIIYYSQQWTIIEENCTPEEANWEKAIDLFYQDCEDVLWSYIKILQERKELYK